MATCGGDSVSPQWVPWVPQFRRFPRIMIPAPTAWNGIEAVLESLLIDFHVGRRHAIEFGVQHAYSTVALSNYFRFIVGIDTFVGDVHAGEHPDNYDEVAATVAHLPNVALVQSTWQEWAQRSDDYAGGTQSDLIHVDIFHTYPDTYECGRWAVEHSPFVIFHDTISFPDVAVAVAQLAKESGRTFYNFEESHGLGILSERGLL